MMFRRFFAFVLLLASLVFASSAFGQSIPTWSLAELLVEVPSPSSGDLAFITDGSGTTTVGDPAAGGGSNRDLVAYDGVDARWEFVQRLPATAPPAAVETVLDANRVRYDNSTSGATAVDVQSAIDEALLAGGGGANMDRDGDGLYEIAYADTDWDGDGTAWKTCDCGGTTTPGFTAGYLCGTYRTSATDDTGVDYSAGDSVSNPAVCRFHGERVWDDITDDITALELVLSVGATIYFPPGTYDMKGGEESSPWSGNCWDSASETWTDTCRVDGTKGMSGISLRKDSLRAIGGGADGNGEKDLMRDGTWMVRNSGRRDDYLGSPPTLPRVFCVGDRGDARHGDCGESLNNSLGSASVLLSVQSGACIDQNSAGGPPQTTGAADGLCDFDGSTPRANAELANRHTLCVDDSSSYVTTNLVPGDVIALTTTTAAGQNSRTFHYVDSIGSANDCGTGTGRTIVLGNGRLLTDVSDPVFHPQNLPGQIFGSESPVPAEANRSASILGPIAEGDLASGIEVSGFTFAHHNYVGDGVCNTGAESACDEGAVLTADSGFGNWIHGNAFVHGNSVQGSGGLLDTGGFNVGLTVSRNVFRFNGGGALVDTGSNVSILDNVFSDNTSVKVGSGTQYLVANQGGWFRVQGNTFERNTLFGTDEIASLIEVAGPYSYISNNIFRTSDATCIGIRPGARFSYITDNVFQCGDYVNQGSAHGFRTAIYFAANETNEPLELIDVSRNMFLAGGAHTTGATPETIKIFFGNSSGGDTVEGDIGPGGIYIHDNTVMIDNPLSSFLGLRAGGDPDNADIFINGNNLSQGKISVTVAPGVSFWSAPSVLPECGFNRVSGATVGNVANECAGTWTIP